ncbi:MAG: ComEA family DNA-binding protein [Phycisphaerales bacterium]
MVPAVVVPAVRIDLNRASVDELALLPEVGPSLASEIVADRATRGAFASVEELTRVRGIGPSVLAALSAHARVSELRAP